MTFCLARESANRVKGHTQRPFPTKERPPEMLILTPEHGITEECRNLDCLDLDGALEGLSLLGGLGLGLGTHDATTPVALGLLVLLGVTLLDGLDELGKLSLVLGANLGDGADGGGLLVDDRAETGLTLDDGVGDTHLAAEGGEEDDKLDGVNIVGDEDESGLLGLNEGDNVVETVLDNVGLLADVLLLLALGDGGGLLGKTLLLVGLGLRAVLVEELEGLGGGVAVKNVLELGDRRRDLQAHVQDLALALQTDVGGPFDEAGQVATGLDVLANTEVLRAALNERVLGILLVHTSLGLGERGRSGLLGTGFGRLSLRRTVSAVQSLKSTDEQRHCYHLLGSSHVTPGTATSAGGGSFWVITAAYSRAMREQRHTARGSGNAYHG